MNTHLCLYCQEIPGALNHGCLACEITNPSHVFQQDYTKTDQIAIAHHNCTQENCDVLPKNIFASDTNTSTPFLPVHDVYLNQILSEPNQQKIPDFSQHTYAHFQHEIDPVFKDSYFPPLGNHEHHVHNLQENFENIYSEYGHKSPSLQISLKNDDRETEKQQTIRKSLTQGQYENAKNWLQGMQNPSLIYPGLRMLPISGASIGTIGGCFWYFEPDKNGKHFLWLQNLLGQASNYFFPFPPKPDGTQTFFPDFNEILGRWYQNGNGLLPDWDKKTGFYVLPGTIKAVFLTNWHNVVNEDELRNPEALGSEPSAKRSIQIQNSLYGSDTSIEGGNLFKWSVPLSAGQSIKTIGENKPDAALVELNPNKLKHIFPLDLPIRYASRSTKDYIKDLEEAYFVYKVILSYTKTVNMPSNIAETIYSQMLKKARTGRHITDLPLGFIPAVALDIPELWSWTNLPQSPVRTIDHRKIPNIWREPYFPFLMTEPSLLSQKTPVVKISTAAAAVTGSGSDNQISVGRGTVAEICNARFNTSALGTSPCFSTNNLKFYRGFRVTPPADWEKQGKNSPEYRNDLNHTGMSGSLVFEQSKNTLCGLLSGTPLAQTGDWLVHHFYDVFRAFDGLLIPGPITLTFEEAAEFIGTGKLPDGCGLYEF